MCSPDLLPLKLKNCDHSTTLWPTTALLMADHSTTLWPTAALRMADRSTTYGLPQQHYRCGQGTGKCEFLPHMVPQARSPEGGSATSLSLDYPGRTVATIVPDRSNYLASIFHRSRSCSLPFAALSRRTAALFFHILLGVVAPRRRAHGSTLSSFLGGETVKAAVYIYIWGPAFCFIYYLDIILILLFYIHYNTIL